METDFQGGPSLLPGQAGDPDGKIKGAEHESVLLYCQSADQEKRRSGERILRPGRGGSAPRGGRISFPESGGAAHGYGLQQSLADCETGGGGAGAAAAVPHAEKRIPAHGRGQDHAGSVRGGGTGSLGSGGRGDGEIFRRWGGWKRSGKHCSGIKGRW